VRCKLSRTCMNSRVCRQPVRLHNTMSLGYVRNSLSNAIPSAWNVRLEGGTWR
jgi:hypothetical protein